MDHKVYTRINRPQASFVDRFLKAKYEIIPTLVPRSQAVDTRIRPLLNTNWKIAGPAVTVSQDRACSFMAVAATAVTQPGDIIVLAVQGDESSASWGGGLTRSAKNAGVAGVVVDGCVMDTSSIMQRDVPVFCRGSNPFHENVDRPGSINVPVCFGGVVVNPGDYVVGDLDGLIVIPQADVEDVLLALEAKTAEIYAIGERLDKDKTTVFELRGGRQITERAGVVWVD